MSHRIQILQGDITRLEVDAIVNAANTSLMGGGGVDGAIHRAAGPQLLAYCQTLGGCPTGDVRLSPGFQLSAPFIIHTVGPIWRGGGEGEDELLASCYRCALRLAQQQGFKTLAFPAISTGVYGFPRDRAAAIAVATLHSGILEQALPESILLVAFDETTRLSLESALNSIPR